MKVIFVVDDNDTNLAMAKKTLENTYRVLTMSSAAKMFKLAEKITPELILLDVEMPEMNGFEALLLLKEKPSLKEIPVVFLTARDDPETEVKGLELGAFDFITKPFAPSVLLKRIGLYLNVDDIIKKSVTSLREIQNAIISVISDIIESRDKITGGHIERTQLYIQILIKSMIELGLYQDEISKWDLDVLIPSAQLHDLGKIGISDLILNKPERLTDEEYRAIQNHTLEGEHIIDRIMQKTADNGFLSYAKMFAGYHHEKWDGTGYPYGLSGQEIPLQGRIMAIADVYDALVSERPYKRAFSHEEAVEIIKIGSGNYFDPAIVEVFLTAADAFCIGNLAARD